MSIDLSTFTPLPEDNSRAYLISSLKRWSTPGIVVPVEESASFFHRLENHAKYLGISRGQTLAELIQATNNH